MSNANVGKVFNLTGGSSYITPDALDSRLNLFMARIEAGVPKVLRFDFKVLASAWAQSADGGYSCEIENALIGELDYVDVIFDGDSLDAAALFGLKPDVELLDGKLRLFSEALPTLPLTGVCLILGDTGDIFVDTV